MSLLRRTTDFLLQNRLQTIAVTFVLAYVPLIGSMSVLIAGLVTLRKGTLEGAYVLIAATLPYLLSYYAGGGNSDLTNSMAFIAMIIIVVSNILVWMFAILLRKYENWSWVLEYGFLLSILSIGLVHIIFPDVQNWWQTQLVTYFNKSAALVNDLPGNEEKIAEVPARVAATVKSYATGLMVSLVLFNAYLQLLISRWWQAVIFNPGGLRKELYAIRFSHFIGVLFIFCIVLNYMNNATAMDMVPVAYATFSVAGFSLIHFMFARQKTGWLWLILTYTITVLLFPISLMVVSILALFDTGMNFRKRFMKV